MDFVGYLVGGTPTPCGIYGLVDFSGCGGAMAVVAPDPGPVFFGGGEYIDEARHRQKENQRRAAILTALLFLMDE